MKCWASILGDCKGKQSREHYVTQALYSGDVTATGLPWAKWGQMIELPIRAMSANILCVGHNNRLSQVDAEAVQFKDFVVSAIDALSAGEISRNITYGTVDGKKLIRWLCKTICNLETLYARTPDPSYVRRALGVSGGGSVRVYINPMEGTRCVGDPSHLRWSWWDAALKKGGVTQVYIMRFAMLEWLVAPFDLEQHECDVIGQMTGRRYWFKARPLTATRVIPFSVRLPGGRGRTTHQLTMKFPRRNKNRK